MFVHMPHIDPFPLAPDEDVRRYREKAAERPLQVPEVDSCVPRTPERVGLTLEDDPAGQSLCISYTTL